MEFQLVEYFSVWKNRCSLNSSWKYDLKIQHAEAFVCYQLVIESGETENSSTISQRQHSMEKQSTDLSRQAATNSLWKYNIYD